MKGSSAPCAYPRAPVLLEVALFRHLDVFLFQPGKISSQHRFHQVRASTVQHKRCATMDTAALHQVNAANDLFNYIASSAYVLSLPGRDVVKYRLGLIEGHLQMAQAL